MRAAMFGGSFNPIHNGHIELVRHFADLLDLDKAYVIPARIPPNKLDGSRLSGELRLEMCRLALEDDPRLEACDIEIRREGVSYTFYTVKELIERGAEGKVYLITGADTFLTLKSWHRFDELKELVTFCTVPRDDIDAERLNAFADELEAMGCTTFVTQMDLVPISSTEVRRRAAEGLSLDGLVPPQVEAFIREHGLYRDSQ